MRDTEIIEQMQNRDEAGMEAFLKEYTALLCYVIAPILKRKEDREECVSEAAMQVWEKIDSYDATRGSFRAWLTAVARNVALNRLRKERGFESGEEIPDELASPKPTPEEAVIKKEREAALVLALEQLKPKERELFYRKYYYMQSTAQIGAELGMTERAVEGKLYRLKKHLRKILQNETK